MDIVVRLLLREEINPVQHDLSVAKAARCPAFARIHELRVEVGALNGGFRGSSRRNRTTRRVERSQFVLKQSGTLSLFVGPWLA
jgi:hypothetical protein